MRSRQQVAFFAHCRQLAGQLGVLAFMQTQHLRQLGASGDDLLAQHVDLFGGRAGAPAARCGARFRLGQILIGLEQHARQLLQLLVALRELDLHAGGFVAGLLQRAGDVAAGLLQRGQRAFMVGAEESSCSEWRDSAACMVSWKSARRVARRRPRQAPPTRPPIRPANNKDKPIWLSRNIMNSPKF